MPIKPPNLDDRRYEDIIAEMMQLVPQYCPEWTNLGAADPGVTLVQLFSWMTEMILYRVNRVPEKTYIHFLNFIMFWNIMDKKLTFHESQVWYSEYFGFSSKNEESIKNVCKHYEFPEVFMARKYTQYSKDVCGDFSRLKFASFDHES